VSHRRSVLFDKRITTCHWEVNQQWYCVGKGQYTHYSTAIVPHLSESQSSLVPCTNRKLKVLMLWNS
jgi:hypothetical protein